MNNSSKIDQHIYAFYQIRDCIAGSNAVKRQNEIYLPMPSGFSKIDSDPSISTSTSDRATSRNISRRDMPWYHKNPVYSAYLMRARFPDITGVMYRGFIGTMTKDEPDINLDGNIKKIRTTCCMDLVGLFEHSCSEILKTSKICFVLDPQEDNSLKIAVYSAERNEDWEYGFVDGKKKLIRCKFIENYGDEDEYIEYRLENKIAISQKYKGDVEVGEEEVLKLFGKPVSDLPIFFANSMGNSAEIGPIPLQGISDIALTIYRKDADLAHAQYMTCLPTLFIYGITEDQKPSVIGPTVAVTISNPNAKAEYPKTDTSGLDHIKESINDLFQEAINMGAQAIGSGKKSAESAEALGIREASAGATLLSIVTSVEKAIQEMIDFSAEWYGSGGGKFLASRDFAMHSMTPQMLTALLSSWISGGISHDSFLNNIRDANLMDKEITNEEERAKIAAEEEDSVSKKKDPGKINE